jgi:hypothetical protein
MTKPEPPYGHNHQPPPCKHIHDDGTSALRPVGLEEYHMEICEICSKVVSSNPPEETDRDLV